MKFSKKDLLEINDAIITINELMYKTINRAGSDYEILEGLVGDELATEISEKITRLYESGEL